jgi:hypothetical protein
MLNHKPDLCGPLKKNISVHNGRKEGYVKEEGKKDM